MQGNIALLTKSFTATGAVTQYQPLSPTGGNATAASNAIGFANIGGSTGDLIPTVVAGTALAIAGATIAVGDPLKVHTTVTQVAPQGGTGTIVARALSAGAAGDVIEVLIVGN
jgi:hypothetical protein